MMESIMKRGLGKLTGFLSFIFALAVLISVLIVINWIPSVTQKGNIERFTSLEDVKAELSIKTIHVPSYFPENIEWPPSVILAQKRPYEAVVMEFRDVKSGKTTLVISQSSSRSFVKDSKIKIAEVKDKTSFSLRGRDAIIETGDCGSGEPCSSIMWNESGLSLHMSMTAPPSDLIRIAESMIR